MSDWNHTPGRPGLSDRGQRDLDGRDRDIRERGLGDRRPGESRNFGSPGRGRRDNQADYAEIPRGGSDTVGGGYGGANVGGWGQSGLTSQWGGGGFGPLNTGLQYGQDGGRFGPQGYADGDFGPGRHDPHAHSYRSWRDAQLANHDRDYGHWRNEQARRYDEEYHGWRTERHSAFSKEFEGWRAGRGGQAATPAPDANATHGANPTLSKIADGHEGRTPHPDRHDEGKDKAIDHN